MLKELASNTTATIENYGLASSLAELISDCVNYGKSKARSEELASKLEVPQR
jgi:hypothetical protein